MRAPADKLPAFIGTEVDNAGYLIAQIVATKVGEAGTAEQREARNRVLAQQAAAADEVTYAEGLKARHNVKILKAEFQKPTGTPAADGKARAAGRGEEVALSRRAPARPRGRRRGRRSRGRAAAPAAIA